MLHFKNPLSKTFNLCSVVCRFRRDQTGAYSVLFALMMPALVGLCGIGTEVGLWFFKQRDMQGTADSSAISAAVANSSSFADLEIHAQSVASSNGYRNGVSGAQVTVYRPPNSGAFASNSEAVEVVVQQPQKRLLSALFGKGPVPIDARAVAIPIPGKGCVLALDPTASRAIEVGGMANVTADCGTYSNSGAPDSQYAGGSGNLTAHEVRASGSVVGKENMTTTQGIFENQGPTTDPYAGVNFGTMPSSCTETKKLNINSSLTLSPGRYCGGISVNGGATLTFNPGIYYIDKKDLTINGGATVNGTGVTLVFTGSGSNYAEMKVSGGATVDLRAPTTGPTSGIVVFGDRAATGTTFELLGGANQSFEGAIYVPTALMKFAGGSNSKTTCTQIVTRVIKFAGNGKLQVECEDVDINPFGSTLAKLVE